MPGIPIPSTLRASNTLLLICDVQGKFRQAIFGFPAMCDAVRKMTRASAVLRMPVMATEQHPSGATVQEVGLDSIPPDLWMGSHPKTKFSMMIPPVQQVLKDKEIDTAIVVGIESHICVLQSTLDLLAANVRVFVLADAVSSVHKEEVPLALDSMRQAGAGITTTESILFRLMRDASRPEFKPFVQLIKEERASGRTPATLATLLGKL